MPKPATHFNFRVLGNTFQLSASFSLKSKLYPRVELLEGEAPADFFINLNFCEVEEPDPRSIKWFRMLKGRIAFEGSSVFLNFPAYTIKIEKEGSSLTIFLPNVFKQAAIPESALDLALMLALREKGYLPLHASGGRLNRAVLFAGKSGSGKSTLVMRLAEIGGEVLSDDHVFISREDDTAMVSSYNHDVYLRSAATEYQLDKEVVTFDDTTGHSTVNKLIPEVLVFPYFTDTDHPQIIKIDPPNALMRAIPFTLPLRSQNDISMMNILCSQCEAYKLNLPASAERPEETKIILKNLLDRGFQIPPPA